MAFWKRDEESIDIRKARQQAEVAKLQEQAARSRARAQKIQAQADMQQAKAERYRTITKVRERNGGVGAGVRFASVPPLKDRKPSGRTGGGKGSKRSKR